jgi:serine/threonine-protein kinase
MMNPEAISNNPARSDEETHGGVAVCDSDRARMPQRASTQRDPMQRGSVEQENAPGINASTEQRDFTTSDVLPAGTELHNGAFRISRVLGRGALGITYFSHNVALHRDVVIKEFFPPGAVRAGSISGVKPINASVHTIVPAGHDRGQYHQQACAAFLEQARAVSRVWHPNVVMVYDSFEENNTAYMVMKFLKGKTLQQFLEEQLAQKRFLPQGQTLAYALHIGRGLVALHKEGLVHGDLHPANVMLCPPGESAPQHDAAAAQRRAPLEKVPTDEWTLAGQRIVLIDCGLNRLPSANDLQQTQWLGDPQQANRRAYTAPELFGAGRESGPATDVYALGATMYHMLTGRAPVEAPERAQGTVLKPPHRENVGINPALSEAVMWALELRSEHRPSTVDAFLKHLAQCGSEAPLNKASLSAVPTKTVPPKSPVIKGAPPTPEFDRAPAAGAPATNGVSHPAPVTTKHADGSQVPAPSAFARATALATAIASTISVAKNGAPTATTPATAATPEARPAPILPQAPQSIKAPGSVTRRHNNSGRHLALAALLGIAIAGTAGWALWREATTRPQPVVPGLSQKATRPNAVTQTTADTTQPTTDTAQRTVDVPPVEPKSQPVASNPPSNENRERRITRVKRDNALSSDSTALVSRAPSRRNRRRVALQPSVRSTDEERSRQEAEANDRWERTDREVPRRRSRRTLRRSRETDNNLALNNSTEARVTREVRDRQEVRKDREMRYRRDTGETRGTSETRSTRRNFRQRRRDETTQELPRPVRNAPERRRLRRATREAVLPPLTNTRRRETRTNQTPSEAGLPPM